MAVTIMGANRNSLLVFFLGVPFDRAILWHRWIGRFTGVLTLVHLAVQLASYVVDQELAIGASFGKIFANEEPVRNLMGFLAAVCLLILTITSIEYFRRQKFEIFMVAHMIFIGFVGFAFFHASEMMVYCFIVAGFLFVDVALRILYSKTIIPVKTTTARELAPGVTQLRFKKHWAILRHAVNKYVFFFKTNSLKPILGIALLSTFLLTFRPFIRSNGTHSL